MKKRTDEHSNRLTRIQLAILATLLVITAGLFIYGWFFDSTRPQPASSWADQGAYQQTTEYIAKGVPLTIDQLHFSLGYPILGLMGYIFNSTEPFVVISLLLLLGSVTFCYLAALRLIGTAWTILFMIALLWWDLSVRSFNYFFELFTVPWNTQVLVFALAYFFWLLTLESKQLRSMKLAIATGVVCGVTILAREEAILICLPLLVTYLLIARVSLRFWVVGFSAMMLAYLPQPIVNTIVKNADHSFDERSYSSLSSYYLKPGLLKRNVWETIIDSRHYGYPVPPIYADGIEKQVFRLGSKKPGRDALLQASPWLWLSPIGIAFLLLARRYPLGVKVFVIASLLLMAFYLSGANMSAEKLRFHCLRYIVPSLIVLNFAVVVALRDTLGLIAMAIHQVVNRRAKA